MDERGLSVRKIVIAGVLGAIAILLGWTRLGFIPVPTAAGNATIMHVPAIVGGILEGWIVGGIIGTMDAAGLIHHVHVHHTAAVPAEHDRRIPVGSGGPGRQRNDLALKRLAAVGRHPHAVVGRN